jgi:hypothetical protein
MKKLRLLSFLLIIFNVLHAQQFVFVKCISGDCQNGKGIAEFTAPAPGNISGSIIYSGTFKEGKMAGEGTISNDSKYYIGNFENDYYNGYGTDFYSKKINGANVPDSVGFVDFCNWDNDGCNIRLTVQRDNAKVAQRYGNNKKHKKFWDSDPFTDGWIMQHANALLASPARGGVPQYEVYTITQKVFYAQKAHAEQLITWDCIAGRQYFVTASGWVKKSYAPLPFAGFVNYQVLDETGVVVFDGLADRYWTPDKDGKYSFTVKFDQGQMYGNGNENVNGVNLSCSLRCRRKTN